MFKLKILYRYGAFISFIGYIREKNIIGYLMANLFNCIVPALVVWLHCGDKIGAACGVALCVLYRLLPAPLDKFSSDVLAYGELRAYPISFWEKAYIRLSAKTVQLSEWFFGAAMALVFAQSMSCLKAIVLSVAVLAAISFFEELVYYGVYLVSASVFVCVLYALLCVGGGMAVYLFAADLGASFWALLLIALSVLCLSVVAVVLLSLSKRNYKPFFLRNNGARVAKAPFTARLLLRLKPKTAFATLIYFELVEIFKIRFTGLLSSVAYMAVFAFLDPSAEYIYVLVTYFAVEMVFANGFNYFGNIYDRSATLLFSKLPVGDILRSKNVALGGSTLVLCALFAVVLGLAFGASWANILLTLLVAVFALSASLLLGSVLSVRHYHLNDSRKKYTVSNLAVMIVAMVLISIFASLLFVGGIITTVALFFMVPVSLVCLYFTVIDTKYLQDFFEKNKKAMIANL